MAAIAAAWSSAVEAVALVEDMAKRAVKSERKDGRGARGGSGQRELERGYERGF